MCCASLCLAAQQVIELQAALNNRRPAAVVANTVGQADELAAAAALAAQLEVELQQQQQQHNDSLRALQQQYEALKLRLDEQERQLQVRATKLVAVSCRHRCGKGRPDGMEGSCCAGCGACTRIPFS